MNNKKTHELISRSLLKTITFRVLVIISDTAIIYIVTRRLLITVAIILGSNLASTFLYYFHERVWNKIQWGRKHLS